MIDVGGWEHPGPSCCTLARASAADNLGSLLASCVSYSIFRGRVRSLQQLSMIDDVCDMLSRYLLEHSSDVSSQAFLLYRSGRLESTFRLRGALRYAPSPRRAASGSATSAPPLRVVRGKVSYSYWHLNAAAATFFDACTAHDTFSTLTDDTFILPCTAHIWDIRVCVNICTLTPRAWLARAKE